MNTQARNRDRSFTDALLQQLLKGCFVIGGSDPAPQKAALGIAPCVGGNGDERLRGRSLKMAL